MSLEWKFIKDLSKSTQILKARMLLSLKTLILATVKTNSKTTDQTRKKENSKGIPEEVVRRNNSIIKTGQDSPIERTNSMTNRISNRLITIPCINRPTSINRVALHLIITISTSNNTIRSTMASDKTIGKDISSHWCTRSLQVATKSSKMITSSTLTSILICNSNQCRKIVTPTRKTEAKNNDRFE